MSVTTDLFNAIQHTALIDTHEHVRDEAKAYERTWSLFDFFDHYVSSDLVSAGMPREHLERMRHTANDLSLEARWALLRPYWPHARTTGYGRAMLAYMRDLFDVDDINDDTWQTLCQRIAVQCQPGWYETVLHDRENIETALVITWPGEGVDVDRRYFRAVPILDHFAIPGTRADLEKLEDETDQSIQTLDQLMDAQEARLDAFDRTGIAAVKIFLAYRRTLAFDRVGKGEAARVFDRIWLSQTQDLSFEDLKPLQDFMTRRLFALATERGLPIQVHTGLQEGNGNYIANSNPTLLANVLMEFGDARFDLFHGGWPYTGELASLAKNFANVHANLCWVPVISPYVFKQTLHTWIETIPANKIFAVGGDSNYIEGAYGHCKLARQLVHDVLAAKVAEGYFTETEAISYAQRVLRDNALDFYRF